MEVEGVAQAEKRRKHEEAIMKLMLEQQQIDKQQIWASGDDADTIEADSEI